MLRNISVRTCSTNIKPTSLSFKNFFNHLNNNSDILGVVCGLMIGSKIIYNTIKYKYVKIPDFLFSFTILAISGGNGWILGSFVGPIILPVCVIAIGFDIFIKSNNK